MSSSITATAQPAPSRMQYFFWSHPEWWSIALSVLSWAIMLPRGWETARHGVQHHAGFAHEVASWMLMVSAMMLPLVIHRVRATAVSSLWARRHRAIAGFLAGYFAPWLLLGGAVAVLRQFPWTRTHTAAALCFAAAALWQTSSAHKRALMECHRRLPLAPVGWRADRDCLRFGAIIARACITSCWPLMLACAFSGHSLLAMTGGMITGVFERYPFRPRTRAALATTLALAACYSLLAMLR